MPQCVTVTDTYTEVKIQTRATGVSEKAAKCCVEKQLRSFNVGRASVLQF